MSNQTKCRNCGGYKTDAEVVQMDSVTGKKYKPAAGGSLLLIFGGIAVFFVVITVIHAITAHEGISIGVGAVAWVLFLSWGGKNATEQRKNLTYDLFHYYCNLCGYRWTWREGSPIPEVNVRPDLIAQGEQRLEEEGLQRQQDNAALHYLLNKDK